MAKKQRQTREERHDSLLERLVRAQEIQADFYQRWDKRLEKIMKILETQMKNLLPK